MVPSRMRAAVWHGAHDVRLERIAVPALLPGTSIVRVTAAGICATDREIVDGKIPGVKPSTVLGHEIVGTVVSSSPPGAVTRDTPVVVDTVADCSACANCVATDAREPCTAPGELGFSENGGWAEFVRVQNSRLYPIPPTVPATDAVAIEPMTIPFGALLECGEPMTNKAVSIVGSGLAAFAFTSAAVALGAASIIVAVRTLANEHLYQRFGDAVEVVSTDLPVHISDVSVDTVGTSESLRSALNSVHDRGLVICYGLREANVSAFPLQDVVMRNLRLAGHTNPRQAWPTMMQFLAERKITLDGVVDRTIGLEQVPQLLAEGGKNVRTSIDMTRTLS